MEFKRRLFKLSSYLRSFPGFIVEKDEGYLRRFTSSEWTEYELWLFRHRGFTLHSLSEMYKTSRTFKIKPKISIIMPVYNPAPDEFYMAIRSILWQSYPFWELCLVDDASESKSYLNALGRIRDKRIKVYFKESNSGIAETSQYALEKATGDYVALMDQDDELYPDALYAFVKELQEKEIDYFYSDRDMLSPNGRRYMHLFKPDWSPEYLLSCNYASHLEIYARHLVTEVGGFDSRYEGSQDYGLVLKVTGNTGKVVHYPMVLYSWRQSQKSVARELGQKGYAFESGVRVIYDLLKRRNLPVREVFEDKDLWRGHYRITWDEEELAREKIALIAVGRSFEERSRICSLVKQYLNRFDVECFLSDYRVSDINDTLRRIKAGRKVFFAVDAIDAIVTPGLVDMIGYLRIDGVSVTGAKFYDGNRIFNVGISVSDSGKILLAYRNGAFEEKGYGAVASVPRNVSFVYPAFWCSPIGVLRQNGYLDEDCGYFLSCMRFYIKTVNLDERIVCVPYMSLNVDMGKIDYKADLEDLREEISGTGFRDPYYNPNLTDTNEDFGIKL